MARTPLRPDDPTRLGNYRLTARLGSGGMGVVYLGVSWDGAPVAVKVLRRELAGDEEFRRRFGREVAALVQVKGVCTVRVIEADSQSATPFVVTEYAPGPSLSEYIDKHGSVAPGMLFGLATGLAEALTTIHAAGIMHRDLKPSNIILTDAGPKVIDFGIARRQDTTAVTKTGMMIGSMGFMAPEQISGHPGPEADIFAWGVTVAYAATGRSPFGAGNTHSVLYRIMYGDADIASVPDSLLPLVEASLAKDPQNRPSARQLLDRLTSASRPENVHDSPTQVILARTWQSGSHPSPPAAHAGWPYAARPDAGSPAAAPPAPPTVNEAPTADSPSAAPPAGPVPAPENAVPAPGKVPVGRGWPRSPRRPWRLCACAGLAARPTPSSDQGSQPRPFGSIWRGPASVARAAPRRCAGHATALARAVQASRWRGQAAAPGSARRTLHAGLDIRPLLPV